MMFSEYLAEEYWHGIWIEQSLRAAGLTDDDLNRAIPLAGRIYSDTWRIRRRLSSSWVEC